MRFGGGVVSMRVWDVRGTVRRDGRRRDADLDAQTQRDFRLLQAVLTRVDVPRTRARGSPRQ